MIHVMYWDGKRLVPGMGQEDLLEIVKRRQGLLWVDLDVPTDEEYRVLTDVFRFHPLAVEDCRADVHHPKLDEYGDYLYMIVHGVVAVDLSQEQFRTEELDLFVGEHFVVSHHREPRRSVQSVRERYAKRPELFDRTTDFLLHDILDALVDNYLPALEELETEIDRVEDRVYADPTKETLVDIMALKRDILHLRRILGPQKEVINRLTRKEFSQVTDAALPFFRDVYDHIVRLHDLTEQYRDVITGAMEGYLSAVSNKMNEVMKSLTAVSTVILPLSFIASVYGMNFEHMPELKQTWGYPGVLLLMLVVGTGMYVGFKRKRWI